MCDLYVFMHKHARLGGSEITSETILGQKQSHSSYMAYGVLHPIFGCPGMHLLSHLTSDFCESKSKVGRTAGGMTSLGQPSSA